MTAALLDRPGFSSSDCPAMGDGPTLEDVLNAVLDDALDNGSAECPVCRARMTSTRVPAGASAGAGTGAGAPTAECGGCGSRLS